MKKTFAILSLTLALSMTARAQIFLQDDDAYNPRATSDVNGEYGNIIYHGLGEDQPNWVPLSGGALLLTALGGAYLLGKKPKKENK